MRWKLGVAGRIEYVHMRVRHEAVIVETRGDGRNVILPDGVVTGEAERHG